MTTSNTIATATDFPHLIQYRDPLTGRQHSEVVCAIHEAHLLRTLRRLNTFSTGLAIGYTAVCHYCADTR